MSTVSAARAARHPLETLGRVGYGVKGVLYVLLGVIALDAAFGPSDPEGQTGALATLAQQPYGTALLWVLVLGLAAYGLWRLALAALDPEGEGDDAKGAVKRVGFVVSAVSYLTLAYSAYQIVAGSGGGGDGGTEERTQTLLGLPGGRWLVGAVAVVVFGYGLYQFVRAYRSKFFDHLRLEGMAARRRDWVRRIGQGGLSARGVVFVLTGTFLARAALQADADEAGGLDQALGTLQGQPAGPWLLALVAIGLVMYGVYCWVNAAYRQYDGQ